MNRKKDTFMCGIVAYIGHKEAKTILLQGLEKLEYRGYDSSGIFIVDRNKNGHLFKEKGRIADLKKMIEPYLFGTSGIGHTRWATHGRPSVKNAHPHQDTTNQFTLVHNGVIENFRELKDTYLADTTLASNTDTEIIVQLISYFAKKESLTTFEALKKTISLLTGSYALALIDMNQPDIIYAAKNKSPLLIGKGENFNALCSDAMAMVQETNQFIELMDGEVVTLTRDSIKIESQDGAAVHRTPYTAEINLADLDLGTYSHYMAKEIDEQPAVLRRIIRAYQNEKGQFQLDATIIDRLKDCDRVYIIACGTSYNAGWVGKQLLENLAHIPTEVHLASEFGYNMPILTKRPFFIFLSQSGETADSRQVLVKVNAMDYPALTLTNVAGSTLSREADYTLLLHAGPEIAVASTKAYTAQITVLAALAEAIAQTKGIGEENNMAHEIGIVATAMESMLSEKTSIEQLAADFLSTSRNAFYIGRGIDYYVVMEAALKLKEVSYVQTEGFAAGELKHGTIALIEEGTPVVAIITDNTTAGHTRGNIQEVRARGAHTLTIVMEGLEQQGDQIVIPEVRPLLAPLVSVVPTQLLAYYTSLHRGNDIDKPRNLAKSVTVE